MDFVFRTQNKVITQSLGILRIIRNIDFVILIEDGEIYVKKITTVYTIYEQVIYILSFCLNTGRIRMKLAHHLTILSNIPEISAEGQKNPSLLMGSIYFRYGLI